jgi:SlyX protein
LLPQPSAHTLTCHDRPDVMSNSAMDTAEHTDLRLTNLEIKASFTDDLLDAINQTLYRQQQQIDRLTRDLQVLREQALDAGSGTQRSLRDDLPPHY